MKSEVELLARMLMEADCPDFPDDGEYLDTLGFDAMLWYYARAQAIIDAASTDTLH